MTRATNGEEAPSDPPNVSEGHGAAAPGTSLFRREAGAMAQQGWLIAKNLVRRRPTIDGPRAVVFVHGFLAAGAVFGPMRDRVSADLGLPTLDFTYGPFGGFVGIAEALAEHIDRHVDRSVTLSIVGHSLGGLVARWYLQELGPAHAVDRLVTLATPHGGTRSARFAPGSLGAALRPGSAILQRLGRSVGVGREPMPHVALVAGADTMVTPPESAGAVEADEVVRIEHLGHNELLFDGRVHDIVVRALAGSAEHI